MKIFQANSFNFAFAMLFLENVCFSKSEEGHNECRNVIYKPEIHKKALIGHVIANESVKTKDDCQTLCYLDPNCVSINYNQQPGVAKNCELNSKSEGHHLTEKPGTVYQAMVNNCKENSCAANKTCQSGFGPNGYRCVCPKCFHGDHCEKDTSDTILSFPEQSIENTVIWENQNTSLNAFTISMWVQIDQDTSASSTPTLLSYSTASKADEIWLLFDTNHKLQVGVNCVKENTDIHINDNKWYHVCFTWENANGSVNVYLDGEKAHSDSHLKKDHTIPRGTLVLGQEQDFKTSNPKIFEKKQSFKGNLTSVNIWNKVLPANKIAHLANNCPSGEGNFVKWTDLLPLRSQTIKTFCGISRSCRP